MSSSSSQERHPAQGDMTRYRTGLFDDENCVERKSKTFCLASMVRQFLESEEVRKGSASFDDEDGHEHKPKRYCSRLGQLYLTPRLSFADSTLTYSVLLILFSIRVLRGFEYISYSLPASLAAGKSLSDQVMFVGNR